MAGGGGPGGEIRFPVYSILIEHKEGRFLVDLEDQLRRALQTKVRIVGRRGKGRIELHYIGDADLERLTEKLFGRSA